MNMGQNRLDGGWWQSVKDPLPPFPSGAAVTLKFDQVNRTWYGSVKLYGHGVFIKQGLKDLTQSHRKSRICVCVGGGRRGVCERK